MHRGASELCSSRDIARGIYCNYSATRTMTMYRLLLVLSLILLLVGQTRGSSWWGRRRRGWSSSCSRVNCVWRDWSGWRACNHPCGTAGTQSRSRGIAIGASCGGSSCSGPSSQTRACNRYCDNGGTPQSGHCDCPDEFWGTCCDKRKYGKSSPEHKYRNMSSKLFLVALFMQFGTKDIAQI